MNVDYIGKQIKAINEELSSMSSYMSQSSKMQIVEAVDEITGGIKKRDKNLEEYVERAEGFKSAIMTSSDLLSSMKNRKFIHNSFHDFVFVLRWHILDDMGYDVGDEPWTVPEKKKEEEESGGGEMPTGYPPGVMTDNPGG